MICSYFFNYTILSSNPTYECYGSINIYSHPNVSNSNYTMNFELVRGSNRTGNKKNISLVKRNMLS